MHYSKHPHSYTLEVSYHKGLKDLERYQRYTIEDLRIRFQLRCQRNRWRYIMSFIPPESVDLNYYLPKTQYRLTSENFEEVGRCIISSILEVEGLHSNSDASHN